MVRGVLEKLENRMGDDEAGDEEEEFVGYIGLNHLANVVYPTIDRNFNKHLRLTIFTFDTSSREDVVLSCCHYCLTCSKAKGRVHMHDEMLEAYPSSEKALASYRQPSMNFSCELLRSHTPSLTRHRVSFPSIPFSVNLGIIPTHVQPESPDVIVNM
jgi:hypothetical protein